MNYLLKGLNNENIVVEFLINKQFIIIGKNIKNRFGEIDILSKKNGVIYIIEVKYRKNFNILLYSISKSKIQNCLNVFYEYYKNFKHDYIDIKILGAFVDIKRQIQVYYLEQ